MAKITGSFKGVRQQAGFDPLGEKTNPFTSGDSRNKKTLADAEKRVSSYEKAQRDLKNTKHADYARILSKFVKANKDFDKTLESSLNGITSATDELEKANKELAKAKTVQAKAEAAKRKRQALQTSIEQFQANSTILLELIASGGCDAETWLKYQKLYETVASQGNKSAKQAKKEFEEFKRTAKDLQDSGIKGIAAIEGLKEPLAGLQKSIDQVGSSINRIIPALTEAEVQIVETSKLFEKAKTEILENAKELEKDGKTLKAAIYRLQEMKKLGLGTRLGYLAEGVAGSKTADVLTGGASKGLSKYVGEEGKLNHTEIYKSLLSGLGDAARQGFEAYRGTRQYGTLGQGGVDTFQAYEAHKAQMAGIEFTTGAAKGQANAVYGAAANQFQIGKAGWSSESARKNYLNEITKLTIQLGNATGVADTEVVELSAAYQQMSGKDAMGALQTTSEAITAALKRNNEVSKQFQMQSKDIATIWRALSSDLRLAGTDLKKFLDTAVSLNVVLGKQGVNMATIKRLQKEVIDLQSGAWGEEGGESLAAMFMATGGTPKAGAKAMADIGGTKQFEGVHRYDLAGKMMEKAKASNSPYMDFFINFNSKAAGDTNYPKVLKAIMDHQSDVFVGAQGAEYMSIARDILNLPNAEKVLDISVKDFEKKINDFYRNMPENVAAVTMTGKQEAARLNLAKARDASKTTPKGGGAPGATAEEIKGASATNAIVAGLADPMKTFANAVDSFAGSVKMMVALTAIKGGLDIFQMLKGGGGISGIGGGIPGIGGAGAGIGGGGLGSSIIRTLGNGGGNLFGTEAAIATGGVTGLKGLMLSGATSVPLLGGLGYGMYKGLAEQAPNTDSVLNAGISGTENTRFIDKNAASWVDTIEKGSQKIDQAKGFWNTAGAGIGQGARYAGYVGSSVVATGADLAANIKDWLGFGPDKTPPQARGVQESRAKLDISSQDGTAVYDPNAGGIVTTSKVVYKSADVAAASNAGNASVNQ